MPANIQLNAQGRLLNADVTVVPIVVPMHKDERKQLFKDIKDEIKPIIAKMCEDLFAKATEPIKRNVRDIETNIIIMDKRLNARMDEEIKQTA